MTIEIDKYKEIRPFNDEEVSASMARLLGDNEFINALLAYKLKSLPKLLRTFIKPIVKRLIVAKWSNVSSVAQIQNEVGRFMESLLAKTTDGITVTGLDKLNPSTTYLFISNHRDIAMDPALVNFALHSAGHETSLIAFGDNLLRKPSATELMKLNKGFVVKRSAKGPRELLKNLTLLSNFIKESLAGGESVWIAQREGRAKDGIDLTDPAILKMFYMAGKQQKLSFSEYVKSLKVVPVSISYENDPCDLAKANELWQVAEHGKYDKAEFEDIDSIVQGILGYKGRVTVAFGEVLSENLETPESAAAEIDEQIHSMYQLYPVNYLAAQQQDKSIDNKYIEHWRAKLAKVPKEAEPFLRANYGNPVKYVVAPNKQA